MTNYVVKVRLIKYALFGVAILFMSVFMSTFAHRQVNAVVSGWSAGNIIDDGVFTNSSTMNVSDIQNFLNSKVPTCDTQGQKTSEYGGGTRAQWAGAKYNQTTFTCLKDYTEGGRSSSQIIYDVSKKYTINPQVLLVLLQKEQGLVTDDWPLNIQYRSATGYGCPDTAPCDSQYYGLTNQLDWSAKMFRAIINNSPTWYTPYVLGNNFIRYSPDSSCGGSTVNIENRATQALYNYTPYQPNSGALNADWGTAPCGAYGNRNFYLYFTSWFGNTRTSAMIYTTQFSNVIDAAGAEAKIGISLSQKPLYEVVVVLSLSNPTLAKFSTTDRVVITPDTWNDPSKNTISIRGNSDTSTKAGDVYLGVAQIGSPDNNFRYINPTIIGKPMLIWQPDMPDVYRLFSPSANKHVFASRQNDIDAYVSSGYQIEGSYFTACRGGEQNIIRFKKGTTSLLAPANSQQAQTLTAGGYTNDGVLFTASRTGTVPVYQLYNQTTDNYFYTTNLGEVSSAVSSHGYTNQGSTFAVCNSTSYSPVYRMFSTNANTHFYTINPDEKYYARNYGGYTDEGVAFYTPKTGNPVYRLFSPSKQEHFFTVVDSEKEYALRNGYVYEGISFAAMAVSDDTTTKPVYRLYSIITGRHFYTTDPNERDLAVRSFGYIAEGEAFRIAK